MPNNRSERGLNGPERAAPRHRSRRLVTLLVGAAVSLSGGCGEGGNAGTVKITPKSEFDAPPAPKVRRGARGGQPVEPQQPGRGVYKEPT